LLDVPVFAHYPWNTLMNTNITNDEVDEMLTMGIPSLSCPAGVTDVEIDDFSRNIRVLYKTLWCFIFIR